MTVPSAVEYARRWASTEPENTTPGITLIAADCAGLRFRRSPHDGGAAAHTFLPEAMSIATRPPPAFGSTSSFCPVANSFRKNPMSETAAYIFVLSVADPH